MAKNLIFFYGDDDLFAKIDGETSRHAAFLRFPDGGSAYDALKIHTNERPTIEGFVSDAFRTVLTRFDGEGKYEEEDGKRRLSFYLPDFDGDLFYASDKELERYVVLSATARWLMARSFGEYAKAVAEDGDGSLNRLVDMLRTRKFPIE